MLEAVEPHEPGVVVGMPPVFDRPQLGALLRRFVSGASRAAARLTGHRLGEPRTGVSNGRASRQSDDVLICIRISPRGRPSRLPRGIGGSTGRGVTGEQTAADGIRGRPRRLVAWRPELFDPDAWVLAPVPRGIPTSPPTSHRTAGSPRSRSPGPGAQCVSPPHGRRALPCARYRSAGFADRRRAADGQRSSPKDGGWAFCSGGDQRIRGRDGYTYAADDATAPDPGRAGRLHILEVQRLIRFMPKVVIAVIPGWAAGGGTRYVVCDLSIASREHGRFKRTDADVGSFDAGYGSAYFARQIGQKFARGSSSSPRSIRRSARIDGCGQPCR